MVSARDVISSLPIQDIFKIYLLHWFALESLRSLCFEFSNLLRQGYEWRLWRRYGCDIIPMLLQCRMEVEGFWHREGCAFSQCALLSWRQSSVKMEGRLKFELAQNSTLTAALDVVAPSFGTRCRSFMLCAFGLIALVALARVIGGTAVAFAS